jgi:16S rRNA (uracil1498-N3)-methyltransferase
LSGNHSKQVVIAIGPEGGFADEEVAVGRECGFALVGLGPRILRTETAALVTLAILGYALGDLG